MRTALLIPILLYSAVCIGQDWQPFPIGDTLYYSQQRGDSMVIERVEATSTPDAENIIILHTPLCQWWDPFLYDHMMDNLDGIRTDKPTYISKDDSVYMFNYVRYAQKAGALVLGVPLHFDLQAGERYTDSKTDMMCIVHDTMTILGTLDSARTFEYYSNSDTATIILSKHHGIVSLPALLDPLPYKGPLILVGYADSTVNTGYRQPQFDDYFDLHPGDLIYWYRFRHGYVGFEIVKDTTYLVDTILEVTKTQTLIWYKSNRTTFSLNGEYLLSESHSAYYYRNGIPLTDMPGWFAHADGGFGPIVFRQLVLHAQGSDTITTARFMDIVDYVDESCIAVNTTDRGASYTYQPPIGLVDYRNHGISGTLYLSAIGSVINGIPRGITELPTTSVYDLLARNGLIYPNPTSGLVHLESDAIEFVAVYSVHGSMLWSGQVSSQTLDLSSYEPGIYVLRIVDRDGGYTLARVVKQ